MLKALRHQCTRMGRRLFLCGGWLALAMPIAAVELPEAEDAQRREQERQRQWREQLEPQTDVPSPPAPSEKEVLLPREETACVTVRRISLEGDEAERFQWVLSAANPKHDPALGRCLGPRGVNLVAKRLQQALHEQGYITSRILMANQDFRDGALRLILIPGKVLHIRLLDVSPLAVNLPAVIPVAPGDVLNIREIEHGLENLKRVPTATADFSLDPATDPTAMPADSDLLIRWQQHKPWRVTLGVDDAGSRQTGKFQGNLTLSLDNPFRLSDLFYLSLSRDLGGGLDKERGTRGQILHYSFPVHHWLFSLTYGQSRYYQQVAARNRPPYVYRGTSQNTELKLTRLISRSAHHKTHGWYAIWLNQSNNHINQTEMVNQRRRTAGWAAGLSRQDRFPASTLTTELSFRRGTGLLDAQPAPEERSGEGTSRLQLVTAVLKWSRPFGPAKWPLRYDLSGRAQWNFSPISPPDRFSIGSRYNVRGFDGQQNLVAERGWRVHNDLSMPFAALGGEAYLGLDYGEVSGAASRLLPGQHLAGAVFGWRGQVSRTLLYDLFAGQPVSKPDGFNTARRVAGFSLYWTF